MGRARNPKTNDALYEKRHAYYLENRENMLAKAKQRYIEDRPAMLAAMQTARDAARDARLAAKREAFYAANPLKITRTAKGSSLEYGKAREFVRNYKAGKPCLDCGIPYPHYIMEFDHVHGTKRKNISDMTTIKQITQEIPKCELVCANCHRERTFTRSAEIKN